MSVHYTSAKPTRNDAPSGIEFSEQSHINYDIQVIEDMTVTYEND